jgi:hypothetical protein
VRFDFDDFDVHQFDNIEHNVDNCDIDDNNFEHDDYY